MAKFLFSAITFSYWKATLPSHISRTAFFYIPPGGSLSRNLIEQNVILIDGHWSMDKMAKMTSEMISIGYFRMNSIGNSSWGPAKL